ncbi:hypothetical protein P7D22_04330 [Lichenihabitans sp. Uapishka_5]|uniref:hypothetical protein n=1 Tax=Lichenihabitans sp. Uapishka_5 TaxID=3037302 RepID=UPI0029E7D2E7|nr:hypothetical protein [Lichenihabitans sp. Uapishka_5]MDX7950405.1 hypothetical protein [Lichenihabitans sp. Uapishka_5]
MLRIGTISLGLGLGTAFATEATFVPPSGQQDFSGFDDASTPGTWSYLDPGFLVDHLPFKLTIGQSISYSDNVANLPTGARSLGTISNLPSRGDFYSDTTISVASRFPMGAQTYFFNGTYAPRRYFTDSVINADNYSVNGGVDFNVANRCSGRLVAGVDRHQAPLEETAGYGLQEVFSTSFNETARCTIAGHVAALFNSGVSRLENSGGDGTGVVSAISSNNYNQYFTGGGLEYALTSLDTLRGLVTYSHRDFTDRPAGLGLASSTDQVDYQFFYDRVISAKLDASVSGGLSSFSFPGSSNTTLEPIYSIQANYRPTPKVIASGTVSRSAGAPQSAVSNLQVSDTQSLSLSYIYSPKITVTGLLSHTKSNNPGGTSAIASTLFANTETNNASLILNYRATPLVTASAAYSYVSRTDTSRSGADAVSNVFRVGLVYTR